MEARIGNQTGYFLARFRSERISFVLRRILQAIPTVLFILIACFFLLHLAPGDAADVLAGEAGAASQAYIEALRTKFQLDQPLYVQLFAYVKNVLMFDLGYSFRQDAPVASLIESRLVPTLLLMGAALLLAIVLGVALGMLAASKPGSWLDRCISVLSLVSYSMPMFWAGLMLIVVFSLMLGWFPTSGMEDVAEFHEGWDRVVDIARHLVMPALTLSLFYLALFVRLMRAAMLEQLGMDYVVTARAKGLTERQILTRHVARNAMLPIITMIGIQMGNLVGGSVIVETVFGWPGLGQLAFDALFSRDLNLLMGIFVVSAVMVVIVNMLVDITYTFIDPRIKTN